MNFYAVALKELKNIHMQPNDQNSETSKNIDELNKIEAGTATGSFAGGNPDIRPDGDQQNNPDNPIDAGEAQNVTDGASRLSDKEAEDARNKAAEGIRQGRDE